MEVVGRLMGRVIPTNGNSGIYLFFKRIIKGRSAFVAICFMDNDHKNVCIALN